MFRGRVAVTMAALALALMPALVHAEEQESRSGEVIFANVIDASVRNADLLADGVKDQATLNQAIGERDVRVIQIEQLLDDQQERMLADTIDASSVLSSNRLLARNAVMANERLSQFVLEQGISMDRIVAVDVMTLVVGWS